MKENEGKPCCEDCAEKEKKGGKPCCEDDGKKEKDGKPCCEDCAEKEKIKKKSCCEDCVKKEKDEKPCCEEKENKEEGNHVHEEKDHEEHLEENQVSSPIVNILAHLGKHVCLFFSTHTHISMHTIKLDFEILEISCEIFLSFVENVGLAYHNLYLYLPFLCSLYLYFLFLRQLFFNVCSASSGAPGQPPGDQKRCKFSKTKGHFLHLKAISEGNFSKKLIGRQSK